VNIGTIGHVDHVSSIQFSFVMARIVACGTDSLFCLRALL
jgi:translation elongation factor EF-Tu-like GTPase